MACNINVAINNGVYKQHMYVIFNVSLNDVDLFNNVILIMA